MVELIPGRCRVTIGANEGYDAAGGVRRLRELNATPHVASRARLGGPWAYHAAWELGSEPGVAASNRVGNRVNGSLWADAGNPPSRPGESIVNVRLHGGNVQPDTDGKPWVRGRHVTNCANRGLYLPRTIPNWIAGCAYYSNSAQHEVGRRRGLCFSSGLSATSYAGGSVWTAGTTRMDSGEVHGAECRSVLTRTSRDGFERGARSFVIRTVDVGVSFCDNLNRTSTVFQEASADRTTRTPGAKSQFGELAGQLRSGWHN